MSTGLEIRAQIDTENVKGLLLINGGAAVALLAALPHVFDKPGFESLARSILWGLLAFQIGLVLAVVHNRLRRICSLEYERHNYRPPPCERFGLRLREPCVCHASILCMWLALIAFVGGGVIVFWGGLKSLDERAAIVRTTKAATVDVPKITPNSTVERDAAKRRPSP
jgi:hypothetical protein